MLTTSGYPIYARLAFRRRLLNTFTFLVIFGVGSAFGSTVTDNGMQWASNDVLGPVHNVRARESTLRQVGNNDEWIEEESNHEWILTFDRAQTFTETVHLKPHVPGLSPRRYMCFVRDGYKRIVQFNTCDAERHPIGGSRSVFLYDTQGHLIEERVEQLTGKVTVSSRNLYEYDSTGQKTRTHTYSSDGSLVTIGTYHRDREKNLLISEHRTADGEFQTKEAHMLDSRGRTIEVVSFDQQGGALSETHMSYDDHGKRVERVGSGRGVNVREIDSYEYDERGNWTKKTNRRIQTSGEERTVTHRAIEYYPD